MTKPTQMEKLEEIVRALKRLAAYRVAWAGTMGPEEREHLDDIDIPRALTLARELRDNAEKIQVCPSCHRTDSKSYPSGVCTVCYAGTYAPALLITDPNP